MPTLRRCAKSESVAPQVACSRKRRPSGPAARDGLLKSAWYSVIVTGAFGAGGTAGAGVGTDPGSSAGPPPDTPIATRTRLLVAEWRVTLTSTSPRLLVLLSLRRRMSM